MDAAITLPSLKTRKLIHGNILGEGNDIISNLPDAIIHHILSFIPTKEVVRTCILSRRWQFLWTSVSIIDLEESSHICRKYGPDSFRRISFLDFVDRILTSYSSSIEKLSLCSFMLTDISRVSKWISSAIQRRVQELRLNTIVGNSFLPHCLLNCESLTMLNLEMDCILQVPNSIHFPNLKTLYLSMVIFFDDTSFKNLFSTCPVLQELSLMECRWKNIKHVAIFVPTLQTLAVDYYSYGYDPEDFLDCEVKIYAERVTNFDCSGNLTINIILCNFSSLVDSCISIVPRDLRRQEVGVRGFNLFEGVRNVKSLTIYHGTLKEANMNVEFNIEDWNSTLVPQCLKSCLKKFSVQYFRGTEVEMRLLGFFLKNAGVLEKMKIYCGRNLNKDEVMNQLCALPRESTNCVIHVM